MASIRSIGSSTPNVVQDVARVARVTKVSPELRRELLGQVAERVGNGEYVKAALTEEAAQALANSPDYQPGQVLHKIV
ncbi:MAG: hypothetical protein AB7P69_11245 [Candidatus Binatia bacterium]